MLDDADDTEIHPLFAGAPSGTEFRKLRKRLVRDTRAAIEDYGMIRPGDRWLVCLSGGKDSYALLAVLHELQWRGLLPVDLLACNLDQGQPNFPATVLPEFLKARGVPHRIDPHSHSFAGRAREIIGTGPPATEIAHEGLRPCEHHVERRHPHIKHPEYPARRHVEFQQPVGEIATDVEPCAVG